MIFILTFAPGRVIRQKLLQASLFVFIKSNLLVVKLRKMLTLSQKIYIKKYYVLAGGYTFMPPEIVNFTLRIPKWPYF